MQIEEERGTFYKPRWELKSKGSPHPARRWCHTTTIHGDYLYIMGGRLPESAKTREFVYRVNCETFVCESMVLEGNPMMRESHSCALAGDLMHVLFGMNKTGEVLKDCLQLKIEPNSLLWKRKGQNSEIQGRESHMSMILDNKYILIYGGIDGSQKLISDFYLYDLERQTWKKIEKVEGSIQGKVGGTLIKIKNQIYLFGGEINDENQYSNSIYKISTTNYKQDSEDFPSVSVTKVNVQGPKPSPRSQFASVAYKDRYLIVLGGQGPNKEGTQPAKLLADVWAFDTEKQVWEEIVPENSNIFKPRSSFTANVYKDNVIVFGGLVAFKDFRSTDQIFVLNLNTETEKKPLCNLCKSSYKIIPKQEIEVQKAKGVKNHSSFNTGFSTISAIASTIPDSYTALSTLLHSFDSFGVEKCVISLQQQKLMISLKNMFLSDFEWRYILQSYEFIPLIQQRDYRVRNAIQASIRQNLVNYLSYNIKNCCLRLGNQLLISWVNERKELQIFLISKFGMYHTMNMSVQSEYKLFQQSIILQHLRESNISIVDLYQSSFTLCVTSLKPRNFLTNNKQISQNDLQQIFMDNVKFQDYFEIGFAQPLSFEVVILCQEQVMNEGEYWKISQSQKIKWPQKNNFPDLFEQIYTYEKKDKSLMLVYQNNKLMHQKQLTNIKDTVFEFHLTNNIKPGITFSDVQPTDNLLNAIRTVINNLNDNISSSLKREKSLQRQKDIRSIEEDEEDLPQHRVRKAVKTNETENLDLENEFEINLNEKKSE